MVEGIVKGICLAFKVPYQLPTSTLPPAPEPSPVPPSEPTDPSQLALLVTIKDIIWGKGWPWAKVNKVKELLPK